MSKTKNEVKSAVVEDNASVQEMEKFIKDNDCLVPKNKRKKYEELSLERKVSKIKFWMEMQAMREHWAEARKVENKVKQLFSQKKPSVEEVMRVIDVCNEYINESKAQEMARLDEEIARLNEMRKALQEK